MEDTEMKDATPVEAPKVTRVSTAGWTLDNLLARGGNFRPIPTVDVSNLEAAKIQRLVQKHENSGIPLLMIGFHRRNSWDSRRFSPEWLKEVEGASRLMVRNIYDRKDRETSTLEYLQYARTASHCALLDETERLYAKDAPCPEGWHRWMVENLPGYMLPFGTGDVSSSMPPESRVETLMTYLGIGDTYTPAHKDPCASVGQNLMVHTSNNASSFWFLTSTGDSYKASMYWRELGQELDHESHVATVEELAKASFPIYVCRQELGGFVIVPPRSCHQVLNSGGLTMKVSWSRMISKSYTLSLSQELRIYQRVCRPEVYRVKATIAAVVSRCSEVLRVQGPDKSNDPDHLSRLHHFLPLYKQMLIESYDPHWRTYETRSLDFACDCCGADIWQSAMVCSDCSPEINGAPNSAQAPLIVCGPCYVDGRSCKCGAMRPVQARPFDELIELANKAISIIHSNQQKDQDSLAEPLSEKDLTSAIHPPVFRVATFLYRYRKSTQNEPSKKCNLYRAKRNRMPDQYNHSTKPHEGLLCSGCHSRACWYHIVEKYNTHIITIATFSDAYQALQRGKNPVLTANSLRSEAWHQFHATDRSTTSSHVPFGKPWMDWLPRLAWVFRSSRPLNDSVLLGWYDGAHLAVGGEVEKESAVMTSALPCSSSLESPSPSQTISSTLTSLTIAPITPIKRKAPEELALDGSSRRKRRVVHYAEPEGSSADEFATLPTRNHRRSSVTWNTALKNRVKQLEEEVERLKAGRREDMSNLTRIITQLEKRLPAEGETAAENIDEREAPLQTLQASFSQRRLPP